VQREIIGVLRRRGVETWCSREDIPAASDWERSIRQALSSCDWFIVALSPHAVRSEWVRSETQWALEHLADRVVPVLVETCNLDELHLRLAFIQHIDFREDVIAAQEQLLRIWNIDYLHIRDTHELRVVGGPFSAVGGIYPIRGRLVVGRKPEPSVDANCTVLQLSDICLARRHAEFVSVGDQAYVEDLGSPNGTLLNGECISSAVLLHDGDEIRCGQSLLLYRHFPVKTSGEDRDDAG
jgi:TIR domain/FHA domain